MKGERRAFTLVEVVVAMVVLTLISTGLLATTWRLSGVARDYVDCTVADSFCHDVIYTATASTNKLGYAGKWKENMAISWVVDPTNDLPRIDTVDLFGRRTIVYPLWRSQDLNHRPICTITYPTPTNISVAILWGWSDTKGGYTQKRTAEGACR